jgi:hypothetical protein
MVLTKSCMLPLSIVLWAEDFKGNDSYEVYNSDDALDLVLQKRHRLWQLRLEIETITVDLPPIFISKPWFWL